MFQVGKSKTQMENTKVTQTDGVGGAVVGHECECGHNIDSGLQSRRPDSSRRRNSNTCNPRHSSRTLKLLKADH